MHSDSDGEANSRKEAESKIAAQEESDQKRYLLFLQNSAAGINKSNTYREKSVLKVQKLVNRLRRFTSELDKEGVIGELEKLDVTMHLSEICDSICQGPLKVKDIPSLMEICSLLYQHYTTEFSEAFKASAWRTFVETATNLTENSMNKTALLRRRAIPRLTIELILIGVIANEEKVEPLSRIIYSLCEASRNHTEESLVVHNVSVIDSLCRRFDIALLGPPASPKQKQIEELAGRKLVRNCCLNENMQKFVCSKFTEFYLTYSTSLLDKTKLLLDQQSSANQQKRIYRGKIDAESETKYQHMLTTYTKLQEQLESLKDLLCIEEKSVKSKNEDNSNSDAQGSKQINHSTSDKSVKSETSNAQAFITNAVKPSVDEDQLLDSIWDNITEKDFYCNLLNLVDAVPAILLSSSWPSHATCKKSKISATNSTNTGNKELSQPASSAVAAAGYSSQLDKEKEKDSTEKDFMLKQNASSASKDEDGENEDSADNNDTKEDSKKLLLMNNLFEKLYQCTSAQDVDQLCITFFYDRLNVSKLNRKRLLQRLTCLVKNDIYILPYISRFIATINPYMGNDIAEIISSRLQQLYKATNTQKNLDTKLKIAKYLSELVKFRLVPVGVVYSISLELLNEFNHFNIEILTSIIQSCGRYLLHYEGLSKDFNNNILQRMLHLKKVRSIPIYCEVMIEDAYYYIFPKEYFDKKQGAKQKKHSMEKLYIEYLILYSLNKSNVKSVLRAIRRLNWTNEKVYIWLYKTIFKSISNSNINFYSYNTLALLLSYLAPIKPDFVIMSIDYLMEYIQSSLENPSINNLPTKIRVIKLLGELFNYRIVSTREFLDLLYHFIGFGGPTSHDCSSSKVFQQLAIKTNNLHLLPLTTDSELTALENSTQTLQTNVTTTAPNSTPLEESKLYDPIAPEDLPGDFIRTKFVCVLLQTSGQYFVKGIFSSKMKRFLAFFQRYLYFKTPIPMSVYLNIMDAISAVNPSLIL